MTDEELYLIVWAVLSGVGGKIAYILFYSQRYRYIFIYLKGIYRSILSLIGLGHTSAIFKGDVIWSAYLHALLGLICSRGIIAATYTSNPHGPVVSEFNISCYM